MKKPVIFLASLSLFWFTSCESKKQEGDKYYDPNYKPETTQATAESESDAGNNDIKTANPAGEAPVAVPDSATGEPAKKSEASVSVVPDDKLKASPKGADFTKGKNLIAKSDCLSCHKDDTKLLGPAYVDVAKKYEATDANINMLANKIKTGGAGVWGEIPMSPHPDLPAADAKEMVRYILSLRK